MQLHFPSSNCRHHNGPPGSIARQWLFYQQQQQRRRSLRAAPDSVGIFRPNDSRYRHKHKFELSAGRQSRLRLDGHRPAAVVLRARHAHAAGWVCPAFLHICNDFYYQHRRGGRISLRPSAIAPADVAANHPCNPLRRLLCPHHFT